MYDDLYTYLKYWWHINMIKYTYKVSKTIYDHIMTRIDLNFQYYLVFKRWFWCFDLLELFFKMQFFFRFNDSKQLYYFGLISIKINKLSDNIVFH